MLRRAVLSCRPMGGRVSALATHRQLCSPRPRCSHAPRQPGRPCSSWHGKPDDTSSANSSEQLQLNRFTSLLDSEDLLPGLTEKPISYKEYIAKNSPTELASDEEALDALDREEELSHGPPSTSPQSKANLEKLLASTSASSISNLIEQQNQQHEDLCSEPLLPSELLDEKNRLIKNDILMAASHDAVLDLFLLYRQELSQFSYDAIVRRLLSLISKRTVTAAELVKDGRFRELCDQLCRNTRRYDVPLLLTQLLLLVKLDLPRDSTILLTTLQMIRQQFNSLSLKQLLFLDALLRQVRQCNLANALLMAIPIVLETRHTNAPLPTDIVPSHIVTGFSMAVRDCSIAMAEKFMMAFYEHPEGLQSLNAHGVEQLLLALLDLWSEWQDKDHEPDQQQRVVREVLLKETLQITANTMDRMTKQSAERIVFRLARSFGLKGDRSAYSAALLHSYVTKVIDAQWPVPSMANATLWLQRMNQMDERLAEHLFTTLENSSKDDLSSMRMFLMPVIHTFAASHSVKAKNSTRRIALLDKLLQHHSVQSFMQEGIGAADMNEKASLVPRLGYDLACLGYFNTSVMTQILKFSADTLAVRINKSSSRVVPENLVSPVIHIMGVHKLWLALRLLSNEFTHLSEPNVLSHCRQFVQSFANKQATHLNTESFVRPLLLYALRDARPDSLVSAIITNNSLFLDHMLVMSPDGQLVPQPKVASTGTAVSIDDLDIPQNSKLLGIIEVSPAWLLNNGTVARSQLQMELKLLAAEGITAVPLLMPQLLLDHRTDEERAQYVASALHQHGLYV